MLNMTKELINIDENASKLNAKQKAFVELMLMKGMTPSEAYMSVYQVKNKTTANTNAYRLMKQPHIITELSSLSNHLRALSKVPNHLLVEKGMAILKRCEEDLDIPGNRKYYMEALDFLAKISGAYQHNTTVTKVDIKGDLTFDGWNPNTDSVEPIDITHQVSNEAEPLDTRSEDNKDLDSTDGETDWDSETEYPDGKPLPF